MPAHAQDPIGLFDSGLGGLTVMREIVRLLPQENLIYLGDTARLPYGNKSPEAVCRYAWENASFLLEKNIKLLVIACFTASSHAMTELEQKLQIPVLGVIHSAARALFASAKPKRIAILATSGTIKSGVIQSLIHELDPSILIFPAPCPLFVPFIEEGLRDHAAIHLIAHHYLGALAKHDIDSALLACTHYPLIQSIIQQVLGPYVRIVEPAQFCAMEVKNILSSLQLANPEIEAPNREFYVTDDPGKFQLLADPFFGKKIDRVLLC